MSTDEYVDVPDEVLEVASRKMVAAALAEFGPPPACDEEVLASQVARSIIRALTVAQAVQAREREALCAKYAPARPKEGPIDPCQAVATAYWLWSEDTGLDADDVAPQCLAGSRLLAFAQGMAAAKAMSEAHFALADEEDVFSFAHAGITHLVRQLVDWEWGPLPSRKADAPTA